MRRLLFAALVMMMSVGCTDLIAPEDPQYEEMCVVYVAENQSAEIPKEVFDRCVSVSIVVVKYPT